MEWKRGGPERGPLFVPAGTKMGPLQDKGEGQGLPLPLTPARALQRWPWGSGPVPPPFAHPPGVGGKARGAPPSHKRRYRTGGCGGLRDLRGLCPRSAHASLPRKPPDPITGLMAPPALASYGVAHLGVGYLVWRYAPISPRPRGPLVLPPPSRVVRRGSGGGHVAFVCGGGWCLVCSAVAESAARVLGAAPSRGGREWSRPGCHRRNHPPGPPVSRVPSGEVHALDPGPPARAGGGGRWPP